MIEYTLYLHLSPNSVEFFNFSTRHFGDVSLKTVGIHLVTCSSFFSSPLPSLLTPVPPLAPLALLSLPSSAQRRHFRPAPTSVPTDAPRIGKKSNCSKDSPTSAFRPASCLPRGQGALGTTNETVRVPAPQEGKAKPGTHPCILVFLES